MSLHLSSLSSTLRKLILSPPFAPLPAPSADALISKCFARLDAVQG